MHPSSPKVTITKLMFGNLNRMETRALGRDGASVHACHTSSLNVVPYILPRILEQQLARVCVCVCIMPLKQNSSSLWAKGSDNV